MNLPRNLIFALPPALLASAAVFSADWAPLGEDARGNVWHIDMASLVREDNTVMAWKRIDFRHAQPHFVNGAPVKRVFVRSAMDCERHRTTIKALGLLDADGAIISVHEHSGNDIRWTPGGDAAPQEAAMNRVCGGSGAKTSMHP